MRKLLAAIILCSITPGLVQADAHLDKVTEARGVVKQFFGNLKGELQAAMKAGGPVTATSVCQARAPIITDMSSANSGWDVGRTSLKLRNPENKPDTWEKKVLDDFEARKQAGEDLKNMEYSEIVMSDGRKSFRYMKAIPTAELCLNCHGLNIKPEVASLLDELYPTDQAHGYNAGDIRGAFTLQKKM